MSERRPYFRVSAYEDPIVPKMDDGWCSFAIHSGMEWDGKDRPVAWQGCEHMLIVHTCGSELPEMAAKQGLYPTVRAEKHYSKTHGCHTINGYNGHEGGDFIQMACEFEQANGVGMTEQRLSVEAGNFKRDLKPAMHRAWTKRWAGYRSPMDLLPGTKTANSCGVHMEMTPVTKAWMGKFGKDRLKIGGQTMMFTEAQHVTVAHYACDLAYRKGWQGEWWRTPHLLGHSDLSPLTRQNSRGGWDPGAMYSPMRFSWEYVIRTICELEHIPFKDEMLTKLPGPHTK